MSEYTRDEFVAGLRALADHLEGNTGIPVEGHPQIDVLLIAPNPEAVARAFPAADTEHTVSEYVWAGNVHTVAEKRFGPARLRVAHVKWAEVSAA